MFACRYQLRFLLCALAVAVGVKAEPATRPVYSVERLQLAVIGLNDPDGAVRERSRQALFLLSRDDLPVLRIALEPFRPISPILLQQIEDAVIHVWMAGEPYEKTDEGFLGVTMGVASGEDAPDGIPIEARTRGFDAYRALENGDIVIGVVETPLPAPLTPRSFALAIRKRSPGDLVHLKIIRRGLPMTVAVRVSGLPALGALDGRLFLDNTMLNFIERRTALAVQFWNTSFAQIKDSAQSGEGPAASRGVPR